MKWQCNYPGMQLLQASAEVKKWSAVLGVDMHEVLIQTNGHNIGLVFSGLEVQHLQPGWTPFTLPDGGPDGKIPLP